jgi:membrane-bound metal-dependent hydrolase YbcI (DUF457 family)
MLFFGHAGITLGLGAVAANLPPIQALATPGSRPAAPAAASDPIGRSSLSLLDTLARLVDIRVLLIGSLLPDIIDKPLGHLIFRHALSNGRVYAHTLLFLLLITAGGGWLYRRSRRTWLAALSFGTATHLLLDEMWLEPHTLLWPFFGFAFGKSDISDWIPNMLHGLLTDPAVYLSEVVGLAIVLWLAWLVMRRRHIRAFLRHGRIV